VSFHLPRVALVPLLVLTACPRSEAPAPLDPAQLEWSEVLDRARGQTVTWAMWQGDPTINDFVQQWVTPHLKQEFGITLRTVSAQGPDVVSRMMSELEAGLGESEYDLLWINGETFYQLRRIRALYGPFTSVLPNIQYVDLDNPFIGQDFQFAIDGYECPWGNVQMAIIYDSARVSDPPRTASELEAWVRAHPGRFTFETGFTGLTFLKSLLIDIAGGPGSLDGPFDEQRYAETSRRLWAYLNRIEPFLWKRGETYPERLALMHQLFAAGELDFTMSNNDSEVDNKILQGLFPPTARAYVLDSGTIQNSHYVGITKHSAHKEAALVVANFLISPPAQYQKMLPSVWGDGTVLDLERLPPEWKEKFERIPDRNHAPKRSEIQDRALKEPAPEYMIRMFDDFRTQVIDS
jgi:putative spermidine/putrescine transport system substrate-binding protein